MLKKSKTKLLILVVSAMMISSLFAGCINTTKKAATNAAMDPNQKVTINFWTISLRPTFDAYFNGVFASYKKTHPNVTIKWTDLPFDSVQSKLIASAAGGSGPDVVNLNTDMALLMASKGALVNLDKEATAAQKSIYIKSLYDSAKTNDGTFAFPWYGAPEVLIYNKALFEKAGITTPPKSYDEMFQMAPTMKAKTGAYLVVPTTISSLFFFNNIPILSSDKTKVAFNTPDAVTLLNKLKDGYTKDLFPIDAKGDWSKMLQLFSTGKLAMINSGPQSIKRIKDEAPDIYKNIDISTPLVGSDGKIANPLMNLVIMKASKNHPAAIDFANFVTNDENQLAFAKQVTVFPSTTKASQDPYFNGDQTTPEGKSISIVSKELLNTVDISIGVATQSKVFDEINKEADMIFHNQKTVDAGLKDAEKNANIILQNK